MFSKSTPNAPLACFDFEAQEDSENEKKREITEHRVYSEEFLKDHELGMVWEVFEHQGWTKACQEVGNVNPEMVRKFYEHLKFVEMGQMLVGEFEIDGKRTTSTSHKTS